MLDMTLKFRTFDDIWCIILLLGTWYMTRYMTGHGRPCGDIGNMEWIIV